MKTYRIFNKMSFRTHVMTLADMPKFCSYSKLVLIDRAIAESGQYDDEYYTVWLVDKAMERMA